MRKLDQVTLFIMFIGYMPFALLGTLLLVPALLDHSYIACLLLVLPLFMAIRSLYLAMGYSKSKNINKTLLIFYLASLLISTSTIITSTTNRDGIKRQMFDQTWCIPLLFLHLIPMINIIKINKSRTKNWKEDPR